MLTLKFRAPALSVVTAILLTGFSFHNAVAQAPVSSVAGVRSLVAVPQRNRIAANADYSPKVPLDGQMARYARSISGSTPKLTGRGVDPKQVLHLWVTLERDAAVQAAFEQLLKDQQTPGSPLYHQWLTPQQIGELYGPTSADVNALTDWFTSRGFTVNSVSPSRMQIELHGTVETASSAFGSNFAYFKVGEAERLSITSAPLIPAAWNGVVQSINGLSEVVFAPQHTTPIKPHRGDGSVSLSSPTPDFSGGSRYHYLSPRDFATIYDFTSVWAGGNTGATIGSTPQHVAVIGRSDVLPGTIAAFASLFGVGGYTLNQVVAMGDTDPGTNNGDFGEAMLDVERVIGTATGATVDMVAGSDGSLESQISDNVNTLVDPVMTISFGQCEQLSAPSYAFDSLFSQGAAEGITTLVSSGDSGASGCEMHDSNPNGSSFLSPNILCASPSVTCVGGTEFNDANYATYWSNNNGTGYESALSYIPEGVWNDSTSSRVEAGGGGASAFFTKPGYQTGPGVPQDGARDTPDVSFTASAQHDGYLYCDGTYGGCTSVGDTYLSGGTSAAAPGMAGMVALLNTKMGSAQGNINPLLYSLAQTTPSAFHDATVASSGVTSCSASVVSLCNNTIPGGGSTLEVPGYVLTAGYDLATGLGSLDVANFLNAAGANILLEVTSAHTGTFAPGDTGDIYTLTVSNAGNAASNGTVTVVDTLPSGFTATALAGAGWSCTLASLTCTRQDALSPGSSYSPISLTFGISSSDSGTYTNMVSVAGGGEGGSPDWTGSDAAVVGKLSAATVSLSFSPASVDPNMTSVLTITIQNPGSNLGTLNGVAFSNTLPAGVTFSTGPTESCFSDASFGNFSASGGMLTASQGTLPPGTVCQITGTVKSPTEAVYTDTTSTVVAGNGNTSGTASATLTVLDSPTKLVFASVPSTPITAGGNAGTVRIAIQDASGNVVTNSSGTVVTLLVTGPNGYSEQYSSTSANGVASIDLSSVQVTAAGGYTYTASSSGLTSATASQQVNPGAAAAIVLSGLAGEPAPGYLQYATMTSVDRYGNTAPSFTGTVSLSSTDKSAIINPTSFTYRPQDGGVVAFQLVLQTAGTWSATATSGSLVSSTVSNLVVLPEVNIVNGNTSLSRLNDLGSATYLGPTPQAGSGGAAPSGAVTVDSAGVVFSVDTSNNELLRFTRGRITSPGTSFTGGGLDAPTALAVDGLGNVWVANGGGNSVSVFTNGGSAISPATGYTSGGSYSAPSALTIDTSGSVWVANGSNSSVTKIFGAAAPVTPPAIGVVNATTGTRP